MEQEMKYIYQVYLDKSISKAAANLFMTQPALSMAVKRVEESVGAELFDRSHHPLEPTLAGEIYLRSVRAHMQLEEELARELGDLKDLKKGVLRIGGTHFLNTYILAPIMAGFSRLHPGIRMELREMGADQLPELLKKGEVDFILSSDPELTRSYEHQEAFCDHVILAVPRDIPLPEEVVKRAFTGQEIMDGRHLLEGERRISLTCFRERSFLLFPHGNHLRERTQKMFEEAGYEPTEKMEVSQLVTAYRLADNGMGLAFISDRTVRSHAERLWFFLPLEGNPQRQFQVILPKRNYTPFALNAFLEYARGRSWDGWGDREKLL